MHRGFRRARFSTGKNAAVLIGTWAPAASAGCERDPCRAAQALGFKVGFIGEAANSVGGYVAGLPQPAQRRREARRRSADRPARRRAGSTAPIRKRALAALRNAEFVVQLSPWKTGLEYADALLPIAPFTETSGTFVNIEGRAQSFYAHVNRSARRGRAGRCCACWATCSSLPASTIDTLEQVRHACLDGKDITALLSNRIDSVTGATPLRRPAAHRRRAYVLRRSAGAPLAAAAEDQGGAAAEGVDERRARCRSSASPPDSTRDGERGRAVVVALDDGVPRRLRAPLRRASGPLGSGPCSARESGEGRRGAAA